MPDVPHPIPYQGSKRLLAPRILDFFPQSRGRLLEPFAGSAALSLAALAHDRVSTVVLNDSYSPLVRLWLAIIEQPTNLADRYAFLWHSQHTDPRAYYDGVREAFNASVNKDPAQLLFLLTRCVKNAVRFNGLGEFNQSPDKRRVGTRPEKMRENIVRASRLLWGRVELREGDYTRVLDRVQPGDVVYLDPPYQGTSGRRDPRYFQQLDLPCFIKALERLVARDVSVIVSFDGLSGDRTYGPELPARLGLVRTDLPAGRSTQATLNGLSSETVESLYVSASLAKRS